MIISNLIHRNIDKTIIRSNNPCQIYYIKDKTKTDGTYILIRNMIFYLINYVYKKKLHNLPV